MLFVAITCDRMYACISVIFLAITAHTSLLTCYNHVQFYKNGGQAGDTLWRQLNA